MTAQVATDYIAELSRPGALTAGQHAHCLSIQVQTPASIALLLPCGNLQPALQYWLLMHSKLLMPLDSADLAATGMQR